MSLGYKFLDDHRYLNGGSPVNLFNHYKQVKELLAVVKKESSMYSYALSLLRINRNRLLAAYPVLPECSVLPLTLFERLQGRPRTPVT